MTFNEYLAMGWMKPILDLTTLLVCQFVLVGCICRLNMLNWRTHKFSVIASYIMLSAFSMGLSIDIISFDAESPSWYAVVGVLTGFCHLWATWPIWRYKPPFYTRKDFKK